MLASVGPAHDLVRRRRSTTLLAVMRVDKKTRGNTLRFVVLDGLARPAVLAGPSDELLRAAYAAIGGDSS